MTIKLNPYIQFNGNAQQVIDFYERALGAKVEALMRYVEMPGATFTPEQKKLVMHAELRIGESRLMLSDGMPGESVPVGGAVQVMLDFTDVNEMRQKFDALAAGGAVTLALHDAFWGATFGVLTDAFGVRWLFNCDKAR